MGYILRVMDAVDFSPATYVPLVPAEETRGLTEVAPRFKNRNEVQS